MNTQSHVILSLFLLKGYDLSKFTFPIILGAFLPDIPIFIFFLIATFILRSSQQEIWNVLYFQDNWQMFFNLFNSIPIFLLIFGIAYYYRNVWIQVFSLSALIHFVSDFLVHREDAHAHFFPFSNWKFMSPVSYWESAHYGNYFAVFEVLLVLGMSVYLWKEYKSKWARVGIVLVNLITVFGFLVWFIIF